MALARCCSWKSDSRLLTAVRTSYHAPCANILGFRIIYILIWVSPLICFNRAGKKCENSEKSGNRFRCLLSGPAAWARGGRGPRGARVRGGRKPRKAQSNAECRVQILSSPCNSTHSVVNSYFCNYSYHHVWARSAEGLLRGHVASGPAMAARSSRGPPVWARNIEGRLGGRSGRLLFEGGGCCPLSAWVDLACG
jgi:hypothetical protein